jgi:hypothetical protein
MCNKNARIQVIQNLGLVVIEFQGSKDEGGIERRWQNLFQLYRWLFVLQCYLLIFPRQFKFRFHFGSIEFKRSLLLKTDG